MKAILEFNLPEETTEHLLAIHGVDFNSVCWELDECLRGWLKHGHEFKTIEEALEAVRNELIKSMDLRDITLDMSL